MEKVLNSKDQKIVRQELRNRMTRSEKILWYHLRGKNLAGYKFRRQQGIGPFIADFYCPVAKLVIEVDGDSHYQPGAQSRDFKKQYFIEKQGIQVLRFTDNEVHDSLADVIAIIIRYLKPPITPP